MGTNTLASRVDDAVLAQVARDERVDLDELIGRVNDGTVVVMGGGSVQPLGIGAGLRVKVNANLGTSPDYLDLDEELRKMRAAVAVGADTIMDLSTGGDIDAIRRRIREECRCCWAWCPSTRALSRPRPATATQ